MAWSTITIIMDQIRVKARSKSRDSAITSEYPVKILETLLLKALNSLRDISYLNPDFHENQVASME